MLYIKKKDWLEIVLHIAFWVGVFYTLSSLTGSSVKVRINNNGIIMEQDVVQRVSPYTFLTLGFLMVLFYGNIWWIFKRALHYKKMFGRLGLSLGWVILIFLANYFIVGSFLNVTQPPGPPLQNFDRNTVTADHLTRVNTAYFAVTGWSNLQITILFIFLAVFGLSVAYYFLKEWVRNELIRNQLQANQYSTEIKFLKSQINPHFLFNTLNNLFSMAQQKGNDELANGISTLSGIMRYMIYESNEETVPLKKEIEYLENCILLNKLRYADDEIKAIFDYPEKTEGTFIAPMLFIPFVENAFKHGVVIGESSQIDISISVANKKQVLFTCENKNYSFVKKMDDQTSGIGLENVKRRLELVYPGKYELLIKNDADKYTVMLKINLE